MTYNFEQKEMTKKKPLIKSTWYNWLISYISERKKPVAGAKDKIMSFFKINTTKDYSKPKRIKKNVWWWKELSKLKMRKQSADNIINNIRNLSIIKKEKEAIRDRIIRGIKNLF